MNSDRRRRRQRQRAACACALWLWGCHDSKPAADTLPQDERGVTELPAANVPALAVAANTAQTRSPTDATPSPDGKRIYYLAITQNEGEDVAGVFGVAADGGGTGEVQTLVQGAPLLTPVGIASSLDGAQLYVADAAGGEQATGGVYALPSAGGGLSLVSGTEGYRPAGLTLAKAGREELLYFTGRDPASGAAGLFSVAPSGGAVRALATGDSFSQPGGVTISATGDAYVADAGEHSARVVRVRGDKVEPFVENIGVGYPAGITLTRDDHTLIVSGLDPTTKHDVVYFVDVATGKVAQLSQTVGAFSESAGLHRAHDVDVFAWADSRANNSGTVYVLRP
ncbi:MAG: hypothetical protein RL701_4068 [Pseudomonadota bacterium]